MTIQRNTQNASQHDTIKHTTSQKNATLYNTYTAESVAMQRSASKSNTTQATHPQKQGKEAETTAHKHTHTYVCVCLITAVSGPGKFSQALQIQ